MNQVDDVPKKKRGRKSKNPPSDNPITEQKVPKKRGRKPKGGKIIVDAVPAADVMVPEPNIILHLKCGIADSEQVFYACHGCSWVNGTIPVRQH